MKVQEIKALILEKTELSITKAHQKALRVVLGQINLESVIGKEEETFSLSKQKIWVDSNAASRIGVTVASNCNDYGLGGSWFTRKVTDIKEIEEFGFTKKVGTIKLNKQTLTVVEGSDQTWELA